MYKYSINCLPLSLCKLYGKKSFVHQHNTRNCNTLRVSKDTKPSYELVLLFGILF